MCWTTLIDLLAGVDWELRAAIATSQNQAFFESFRVTQNRRPKWQTPQGYCGQSAYACRGSYVVVWKGKNKKKNWFITFLKIWFKGCGMGPWLVLVSPCFRENVVATCKIGSFWCSLDNLLQKNVIVLFFGNQLSKSRSFEKRAIFDLLFTFFSHQGKVTKIPSAHISLTYIHVFCSPYCLFVPYQFWKEYKFIRYGFSLVWVLVLILIHAILEQSINNKMVSKI